MPLAEFQFDDLTRELQLIRFNTGRQGGRTARRLAELGGLPLKTERNGASSQLGYRWRLSLWLWKRNPSPNKRGRNGLSLSMLSRRPI
jgi:hypothetical protein